MRLEDIKSEIEKLKRYAEILASPDEFFRHMNGHRTELSLVLSTFALVNESETILLALQKQIPKKPLLGGNTDKLAGNIFICPSCSGIVGIDDERAAYCADCGQKLDWGN